MAPIDKISARVVEAWVKTHRMTKTLLPPVPKHILPSTRITDDKFVVILSEGDGGSYPEPSPGNVKHVARNTNDTVGKGEHAGLK
jgi:hypothetical protein